MSGAAFHNGGGRHGDEGRDLPRIPSQREQSGSPDDLPSYDYPSPPHQAPSYDHATLKSLLGAWALTACSHEESLAVEVHLTDCAACADEALRMRDAVALLHQEEPLDLDPLLRAQVLERCLGRRPARIPVPEWAGPYDAEAARLDALLQDLGDADWKAPVDVQWYADRPMTRQLTVSEVVAHLTAVDSLVGRSLGLPAPGMAVPGGTAGSGGPRSGRVPDGSGLPLEPAVRTAAYWAAQRPMPGPALRGLWREQSHRLVRRVSFADHGVSGLPVDYGDFALPLRDAFLDRAFECWIHAADIAEAVAYPYAPPAPDALNRLVDLAARLLPGALADRRRAGLTRSPGRPALAGTPGRSLLLQIDGDGGGQWFLPLDSPSAPGTAESTVARVAMDSSEFCQLAAGHLEPERILAGQVGDRDVIRDVIYATASLSRL